MAEFAALPLFTDSLLADTGHLTDEEFGRYIRLLIITWRSPECRIPADPNWISKRLRLDPMQYPTEIKPLIDEFYAFEGGWYMQKRLTKEFLHVRKKSKKNRAAAKSRWKKEKDTCERISERNAPTPTPSKKNPPLPPLPGGGVSEKGSGEKNGCAFDIELLLDDSAISKAKANAPGWDIYYLMRTYNQGVNSGKRSPPKSPNAAFPKWCASYTKGKKP